MMGLGFISRNLAERKEYKGREFSHGPKSFRGKRLVKHTSLYES
jgi:hypothetical protein